jgi:hypothetical protein
MKSVRQCLTDTFNTHECEWHLTPAITRRAHNASTLQGRVGRRRIACKQIVPLKLPAEEDFADPAFVDSGNNATLFKPDVTMPRLRLRFINLR